MTTSLRHKSLTTLRGAEALAKLEDRAATVTPYADRLRALQARLGQDFSAIIEALDQLPLARDGDVHRTLRADAARVLGPARERLKQILPRIVAEHLAPLDQTGSVDMMADVIVPLTDACLGVVTQIDLQFDNDSLISRVFSEGMGVAKRRRLNSELAALRSNVASQSSASQTDTMVSIMILGRDALLGTLAGSLVDHIRQTQDGPLNAIPFDRVPTATGVPYVDRVDPDGHVSRCELSGMPADARLSYFGKGAHVCLGRAIALDIFDALAKRLQMMDVHVSLTHFSWRKDDVFWVPGHFEVKIWKRGAQSTT